MKILFEDAELIVCVKPVGVLSEGTGADCMPTLLHEHGTIYPVHRLDRAVGGLMVYAKTKNAAAHLARQVSERQMQKIYLAVVHGTFEEKSAVLQDILFKDSAKNKSYVVKTLRKGAKKASLEYRVADETAEYSLVRVLLHTGRTHQIRVQFASRRHPLAGDGKYGGRDSVRFPALWSFGLCFTHPVMQKQMNFREPPQGELWSAFVLPQD